MTSSAREILEARSRALAERPEAAPVVTTALTLFRVHGELYGVRAEEVDAASQLRDLSPVPGAPAYLLGATLHRGQVLSLVDLAALWDLPRAGVRDLPAFVVLAQGGRRLGVLAEQLVGTVDLDGGLQAYVGPARAGVISLGRRRGEPVPVIGAEALLSDPRLRD